MQHVLDYTTKIYSRICCLFTNVKYAHWVLENRKTSVCICRKNIFLREGFSIERYIARECLHPPSTPPPRVAIFLFFYSSGALSRQLTVFLVTEIRKNSRPVCRCSPFTVRYWNRLSPKRSLSCNLLVDRWRNCYLPLGTVGH